MGGWETLIGNALAFFLKQKTAFATKAIPIALMVFNVFWIMLRTYDPTLVPEKPADGVFSPVGYAFGGDALYLNVGWFGSIGGLFATALQETAKQMALHAFGKNTIAQYLIPVLNRKLGNRVPTA
jgi:hypothetical protein